MDHEQRQVEAVWVLIDWYPGSAHGSYCPMRSIEDPLGRGTDDPDKCDCWIRVRSEAHAKVLDEAGLLCALYVRPRKEETKK